ncbi:UspA domain protein (plasmid) [Natrialba magadii ATCC 43099]|uniref:UspA domain protein n=1 Tax=Natrialba magadii (strain ATCC 43099 / DSM 3394 / CCM 3739 / CIP 104546 / IAM 13178 / JCM 8861 / NBRC 102185 / NCIMB 2190 / MS3) TaxID=547559 RepID=D3T195_NATMM|nr:universal stress protein [Natrialba magadii]ADD07354.1 UspA domain protein [Natrialba magadii ATCC 43099]ELY32609.1 UspA domain-containing protein [Natrialba magadii ATCC 43099]
MNEYNDILIATDGSDVATDAATAGIALAETLSASVHALSVVEEGRGSDDRRKRREAYAKEVATRASEAGLESAAVVRAGRPASTVLEHADEVDADLIVVGTHGRTGLRQALLGSVALEVIRDARRPVLTVGAGAEGPVHLADGDVDDVCLATDGLTGSAAATEHALALADACDATLHVLYAVEPDGDPENEALRSAFEKHGEKTTAGVTERADERGVDTVEAVEQGAPTDIVLEYTEHNDVDLLVMGTESKSNIERLVVGSVSQRVVPNASVPVLTVRTLEDS